MDSIHVDIIDAERREGSPVLCKEPGKVTLDPFRETPEFRRGVERLLAAAEHPDRRLVLMCACKRPHNCHRSRLVAPALVAGGAAVLHLDADETIKDQATVEAEASGFQPELF